MTFISSDVQLKYIRLMPFIVLIFIFLVLFLRVFRRLESFGGVSERSRGKAPMTLEQAKPLTPGWELPICLEKQKCLVSRFFACFYIVELFKTCYSGKYSFNSKC